MKSLRRVAPAGLVLLVALATTAGGMGPAAAQVAQPALTIGLDPVASSGEDVTYRIVVTNRGSATAQGIVVTNRVPTNTTFKTSVPPPSPATPGGPPSCVGKPASPFNTACKWEIGDIAPGRTATIDYTLNLLTTTATYTIDTTASAVGANALTASNQDRSVARSEPTVDDTYVDDTAAINTFYGGCAELRLRRDDTMTGYVRAFTNDDGFPVIERLFSARLIAKAKAADADAPNTQIGLHRITDSAWIATGSAGCNNTNQTGARARTGAAPPSASTPTAVASFTPAATLVWDVTADMDSDEERAIDAGWELIDEGSSPGGAVSELHSAQAAAVDRLELVLVHTLPERPTCLEVAPLSRTTMSAEESLFAARLTDGTTAQQPDLCNGMPLPGEYVQFTIDDDDPDVYASSSNGRPALYRSNTRTAPVDPATGVAEAGFRLVAPEYGEGDIGDTAISAHYVQNCGPDFVQPGTSSGQAPQSCKSTGGPAQLDASFNIRWVRGPEPPVPPPPPPPEGNQEQEPEQQVVDPGLGAPVARALQLESPARTANYGDPVGVSGRVTSPDPDCVGREPVQLWRRYAGRGWELVSRGRSSANGSFSLETVAMQSAAYLTVVDSTGTCIGVTSSPVQIRSKPLVALEATRSEPLANSRFALRGTVVPKLAGKQIIIERRTRRGWRRVASARLDRRSRYRRQLTAAWRRERTFRARWRGNRMFGPAVSDRVTVTVRGR